MLNSILLAASDACTIGLIIYLCWDAQKKRALRDQVRSKKARAVEASTNSDGASSHHHLEGSQSLKNQDLTICTVSRLDDGTDDKKSNTTSNGGSKVQLLETNSVDTQRRKGSGKRVVKKKIVHSVFGREDQMSDAGRSISNSSISLNGAVEAWNAEREGRDATGAE